MKLILAIVNDDDAAVVSGALTKAKLSATKLATTGGYLKAGNTTFIIGVENEQVDMAIEIIGNNARKRTQIIQGSLSLRNGQHNGHASRDNRGRSHRLCA